MISRVIAHARIAFDSALRGSGSGSPCSYTSSLSYPSIPPCLQGAIVSILVSLSTSPSRDFTRHVSAGLAEMEPKHATEKRSSAINPVHMDWADLACHGHAPISSPSLRICYLQGLSQGRPLTPKYRPSSFAVQHHKVRKQTFDRVQGRLTNISTGAIRRKET